MLFQAIPSLSPEDQRTVVEIMNSLTNEDFDYVFAEVGRQATTMQAFFGEQTVRALMTYLLKPNSRLLKLIQDDPDHLQPDLLVPGLMMYFLTVRLQQLWIDRQGDKK